MSKHFSYNWLLFSHLQVAWRLLLMGLCFPLFIVAQPHHHLKVGVYDNPPKIFINEHGQPDGIFRDVLESAFANEKISIEYVPGKWSDLYTLLQEGKIDVLPDMAFMPERDSIFNLSVPVLSSWLQVFTTSTSIINKVDDLKHKRIGVLKSSSQENYVKSAVKKEYHIDYELTSFDTYTLSVAALKNNEIDALIADRFFYFSELCDKEILPSGVVLQTSTLHFAFSKSVDPSIAELLNKKITLLFDNPTSDFYLSLQKWFNKHKTILPEHIKWIIAFLAIAFLVFLLFTVVLQASVKAKTKTLNLQNQELTIAKEKAEESDRLKTAFLQNLSHEIRTPMNGILGFIDLLQEPHLNDESQQHYIDVINKSSERLLSTMNDIIEISQIESHQIVVRPTKLNVAELMDLQYSRFLKKAESKGLLLVVHHALLPEQEWIETDKVLLNGILTNLLNNAIKFTDSGTVEFRVIRDQSQLTFYVRDSGIGIPADKLETIFSRFANADLKLSRPYDGTGLGLAIAKAYVELLGGSIGVETTPTVGSVFYFTIPV